MSSHEPPGVQIYDPPMCCSTGLCGPTVDPVLMDVNEMVLTLQAEGWQVERYRVDSHPQAFMAQPDVARLVRDLRLNALPITVVHGKVLASGRYPTLAEVRAGLRKT